MLRILKRGYKRLHILPEVKQSLAEGRPVVALESTIITHGMPYPQNLETAKEVESLVRRHGAVPATCAILDGCIKVGLTESQLESLASKPQSQVVKCSRRDLAMVLASGRSGGTTVAGTVIIAHMAGIKVFATGGIGGVHREGHVTMDISADLIELGRNPVAVVCSGVKSILDIPRTLEFLETQGVCVASYGSAKFPDFYTRDSGYVAPYTLSGAAEAAALIKTLHEIELKSGVLIGVPIPEEFEVNKELISKAIAEAQAEANRQNITGKHITPFLLERISQITGGNSLQANIALIKNNATVAAQIAAELSRHNDTDTASKVVPLTPQAAKEAVPVIFGASILDLSLTLLDDMPSKLNGATYHTLSKQSAGGVGRNIAEGIYKLHGRVHFVSVVGPDELGKSLLHLMPAPLRNYIRVEPKHATSMCSVIFDKHGDCKWILGNMEIHGSISSDIVEKHEAAIRSSPLVIMDGNLSLATMETVLLLAGKHKKPVLFEPTDMRIAGKPFQLPAHLYKHIKIITPNIHELKTIAEALAPDACFDGDINIQEHSVDTIVRKATKMLKEIEQYFDCILVTLSHHGVLISLRTPSPSVGDQVLYDEKCQYITSKDTAQSHQQRFYPANRVDGVVNVSGAGDSFCSGFITGLLRAYDIDKCASMGFLAAERALKSDCAVPKSYFDNDNDQQEMLKDAVQRFKNVS